MRQIVKILLLFFFLQSGNSYATNFFSRMNGNWSDGNVWSNTNGGPACNCTPGPSDDITINHNIVMTFHLSNPVGGGNPKNGITGSLIINAGASLTGGNTYDLQIRANGYLYLCGALIVRNLQFFNGSTVNVCPTGQITVNGNFENNNNSNTVSINGSMTVAGSFQNGNGGSITGTGTVNITNGPVTNTGNLFGCSGNNPCSSYPCSVISPCGAPLPVTWLSFSGKANNTVIDLFWTTASEINNSKFIVERSIDGESFKSIAEVVGNGNSHQTNNYKHIDKTPFRGLNYYRLKQVDNDDASSYSKIIAVRIKNGNNFDLHPNPWKAGTVIAYIEELEDLEFNVTISDKFGREVYNQFKNSSFGQIHLEESDLGKLMAGTYFVKIAHDELLLHSRLVIVK